MALTLQDIDFNNKTLFINKTIQRIKQEDIITAPKTPKSNKIIPITDNLANDLKAYVDQLYDLKSGDRIFNFTKYFLHHEMDRSCRKLGVKRIRVHDLRHVMLHF